MKFRLIAILSLAAAFLAAAPAEAERALGGARGIVKSAKGEPLEGMMVQLIAERTAIRTTVFSNETGRFEFPKLGPGRYVLRIARPREFPPFVREGVEIA